MKSKYRKLIPLILIMAVCVIFLLLMTGCSDYTLKGKYINYHGDAGRSNSYEKYDKFIISSYYTDNYKNGESAGAIVAPMAMSDYETIYPTTDGRILKLTDEDIQWTYLLPKGSKVGGYLCADPDQNIYAVDNNGTIYSLSFEGKLRWKTNIVEHPLQQDVIPCDLLAIEGGILAGTTDGMICKIAYDGKMLWKKQLTGSIMKTLSAENNNPLVVIVSENDETSDTLEMLNADGSVKWKRDVGMQIVKYPVSGENMICVAGIRYVEEQVYSSVFAYDNSGKLLWQKKWTFVPRTISISQDNDVYVNVFQPGLGEQISALIRLDKTGKMLWKKFFNFTVPTALLISKSVISFLGVTSNTVGLYYVNKETGVIDDIQSYSNEASIIHAPTVRPNGAVSFAFNQNIGFLRVDKSWISKMLPF